MDACADIHPLLLTLPVDFTVPYGFLYTPKLSDEATAFLNTIIHYHQMVSKL